MSGPEQIPCGECDTGIYDFYPFEAGQKMFGECPTRIDALRIAPRCKNFPKRICFGARDWIISSDLPK